MCQDKEDMKIIKATIDNLKEMTQQALSLGQMQSSCVIFLVLGENEVKNISALFPDEVFLNVSKLLAERLISMSRNEREDNLATELKSIVFNSKNICHMQRIQFLFAEELNIDPIKLLQQISRKRPIVAIWPGGLDNNNLFYATPGHAEYINYQLSELQDVQVISTCEHGVTK